MDDPPPPLEHANFWRAPPFVAQFFGIPPQILVKKDSFGSKKDAWIFLGNEKTIKVFFGYAKKSSDFFE